MRLLSDNSFPSVGARAHFAGPGKGPSSILNNSKPCLSYPHNALQPGTPALPASSNPWRVRIVTVHSLSEGHGLLSGLLPVIMPSSHILSSPAWSHLRPELWSGYFYTFLLGKKSLVLMKYTYNPVSSGFNLVIIPVSIPVTFHLIMFGEDIRDINVGISILLCYRHAQCQSCHKLSRLHWIL